MLSAFSNLLTLLDKKTKLGLCGLFALGFVAAILEMMGIGLLLPLLQLAINPDHGTGILVFDKFLNAVPGHTQGERFLVFACFVFIFYCAKNIILGFVLYAQRSFSYRAEAKFTSDLFSDYLARSYSFHTNHNSADIIRTLTRSSRSVFLRVLIPMLEIGMELLLSAATVAVLLIVDPITTLVGGGAVTVTLVIFIWATRRPLSVWGLRMEQLSADILRSVQHGLGAIKEILVHGRSKAFIDEFARSANELADLGSLSDLMPQLPRLFAEVVATAGLLSVLAFLASQPGGVSNALPLLGVFAAAILRLMPSLNRIAQRVQVIRHGIPSLDIVLADIRSAPVVRSSNKVVPFHFQQNICLDNVTVYYPGRLSPALDSVSISIKRGEAIGLVGSTGSGKTTLADVLLGLIRPSKGKLIVDGTDLTSDPRPWQRSLGFVSQSIFLIDDSIRSNIAIGVSSSEIDEKRLFSAIHSSRLEELINSLPHGLDTRVGERGIMLSGGQRQRIGIARALYNCPDFLVLDEATSALDGQTEGEVTDVIHDLHGSKTILIIAHRLPTLRNCDRLIFLDSGKIIDMGTFLELYERLESFRKMVQHGEYGIHNATSRHGVAI